MMLFLLLTLTEYEKKNTIWLTPGIVRLSVCPPFLFVNFEVSPEISNEEFLLRVIMECMAYNK